MKIWLKVHWKVFLKEDILSGTNDVLRFSKIWEAEPSCNFEKKKHCGSASGVNNGLKLGLNVIT